MGGHYPMSSWFTIRSLGAVIPAEEPQWSSSVPPAMKRKDPRIWQMAFTAAQRALDGTGIHCNAIIAGTALGALDETRNFLDGVFGEGFGSPRNFIASVHNSMAGKLALDFSITGPNLTVCDGHNSMASALSVASLLQEHELPALLLLIDERITLFDLITPHLTPHCSHYIHAQWKEAAIAFIIDKYESGTGARIRGFGPVITAGKHPEEQCRKLAADSIDTWQQCNFIFNKSTTSFIQPVLEIKHLITTGKTGRTLIGSYSPTSNGCALIEYAYE
jgi:hypothetical protein